MQRQAAGALQDCGEHCGQSVLVLLGQGRHCEAAHLSEEPAHRQHPSCARGSRASKRTDRECARGSSGDETRRARRHCRRPGQTTVLGRPERHCIGTAHGGAARGSLRATRAVSPEDPEAHAVAAARWLQAFARPWHRGVLAARRPQLGVRARVGAVQCRATTRRFSLTGPWRAAPFDVRAEWLRCVRRPRRERLCS